MNELWVKYHTLTINMELCSKSEHSHATILKVFFYVQIFKKNTWKHSSLFTKLWTNPSITVVSKLLIQYFFITIIGRLDFFAINLRFNFYFLIYLFFVHEFTYICVSRINSLSVNWINSQTVMPSNKNKAPVSGLRITDRNCSVSAAPLPLSAAVVLLGVLWSIHGARSGQKSTIVCPPPT